MSVDVIRISCPKNDLWIGPCWPHPREHKPGRPRSKCDNFISDRVWSHLGAEPPELSEIAGYREGFRILPWLLPPTLSRGNAVWKRIFLTWYRKMYPRLFNTVSMHQLWNSAFLTTDPEKMVVMANSKPNHFGLAHWTKMPQWTDIIGVKSTVRQTAIFFVSDERNE